MIALLVIYGIIALVFGGALAFMGIVVIIDWRDNKADVEQESYDEGYRAGCRQRFRDRCEYERRAKGVRTGD